MILIGKQVVERSLSYPIKYMVDNFCQSLLSHRLLQTGAFDVKGLVEVRESLRRNLGGRFK